MPTLALRCLLVLIGCGLAFDAAALRCGTRVVSTGDYDFQVRERCGEPYWVNAYAELLIAGHRGPIERRVERVYEDWYYNFGSTSLVRRLRFLDGRLIRIDTLGYGTARIGSNCTDTAFVRGTTPGELVLRCGPPAEQYARYQDEIVRDGLGNARVRPVRYEEWRYRLPRSRFVYNAIFIEGRLARVDYIPL